MEGDREGEGGEGKLRERWKVKVIATLIEWVC